MVGVDEVGRGCWAGPLLVTAARSFEDLPQGLTDSKLLSRVQREFFLKELLKCCQFGEGWVSSYEIDRDGLASALRLGIARALKSLKVLYDEEIILDGSVNYLDHMFLNGKCAVNADLNTPIVSAASIYAKVTRDNFMARLAKQHPEYGFDSHVGYGTARHRQAIKKFGILDGAHRTSFKPIGTFINP
jgi:ribonuclease HII